MRGSLIIKSGIIVLFFAAMAYLLITDDPAGTEIINNTTDFGLNILTVLPCAFILIGLFEVWVKEEKIKKHLGSNSGFMGHFWVILLASTTVGGLYVAFPVALAIYRKGARLAVIFSYIGAAAIVRIPMTIFEASFLGLKFSIIRLAVSLPLVIISAELLAFFLSKQNFQFKG